MIERRCSLVVHVYEHCLALGPRKWCREDPRPEARTARGSTIEIHDVHRLFESSNIEAPNSAHREIELLNLRALCCLDVYFRKSRLKSSGKLIQYHPRNGFKGLSSWRSMETVSPLENCPVERVSIRKSCSLEC